MYIRYQYVLYVVFSFVYKQIFKTTIVDCPEAGLQTELHCVYLDT